MLLLTSLSPSHAREAARLHIAGQPGTFLTSLGPEVLTVVYQALSQSSVGFGFAAMAEEMPAGRSPAVNMAGYISATTNIGRLFAEIGTRRLNELLPPLLAVYARNPGLVLRSAQTVLYPLMVKEAEHAASCAELLSIMVEPYMRGHGIGALLIEALLQESHNRRIDVLTVTVDAANPSAQRFYVRHGFTNWRTVRLYGRDMQIYRRILSAAGM